MNWSNSEFEVQETNGVKGLFSKKNIPAGTKVFEVVGEIIATPNKYSVQVDSETHVNVDAPIKFINHNCHANLRLEGTFFYAEKDITAGEEVVFNYLLTEAVLAEPFNCFSCGRVVKGKKYINETYCELSTG